MHTSPLVTLTGVGRSRAHHTVVTEERRQDDLAGCVGGGEAGRGGVGGGVDRQLSVLVSWSAYAQLTPSHGVYTVKKVD